MLTRRIYSEEVSRFVAISAYLFLTTFCFSELTIYDFQLPAQDESGWTILEPNSDSRLVYVDSELGDDSTGEVYSVNDEAIGGDPRNPVGAVHAFETIQAAYAQTREYAPDWMLLRAGRAWEEQSLTLRRGAGPFSRSVICVYGEGERPELRTGTNAAITNERVSFAIVSGIKFWAHTRDTDGPYFESHDGTHAFQIYNTRAELNDPLQDLLVEDCYFRSYRLAGVGGSLEGEGRPPVERLAFRRTIFSGFYADGFSIGLGFGSSGQPPTVPPSILLEECTFDHNGWRVKAGTGGVGEAEITNHNTYFTDARNVLFKGNIFMRSSSIENKWTANNGTGSAGPIVLKDNLYTRGEIGISAGGNNPGAHRFLGFEIIDNVFTGLGRSQPSNRSLAWYVDVQDWENGLVKGNLLLNQDVDMNNVYAFSFSAESGMRNVQVENNIVHNIGADGASGNIVRFYNGGNVEEFSFVNNVVQTIDNAQMIDMRAVGGYSFSGRNGYHSDASPSTWFDIENSSVGLSGWKTATGDDEAEVVEPDWNDAARDLERYVEELGIGTTFEDFIEAVHQQSKSNWREELTAPAINDWFRAGFESESRNDIPVARISASTLSGISPLSVEFDASDSSDADDDSLAFEWNFDDGNGFVSGTDIEARTFETGEYIVMLRVSDGTLSDTANLKVDVCSGEVTGIQVSPATLKLSVLHQASMTAHVLPEGACDSRVSWHSTNESAARVRPDGVVTGIRGGLTEIQAISNNGEVVGISRVMVTGFNYWGPFSKSQSGDVNTENYLGWIVPQGDWIWVWALGKYVYHPEAALTPNGSWIYIPITGEPDSGNGMSWAGYARDADGNVNTGEGFLGWINVNQGDWVWVWPLGKYIYLPEGNVSAQRAWAYNLL